MNKTIRFKLVRNSLVAIGLLLTLGLFSACVTNVQVTGDGRVIGEYKIGYLIVKPNQSFERVRAATKSAFKELGYLEVGDEQAPGEAVLKARDATDTLIEVKLKDYTSFTNVKIRCGVGGDLARSQQVYQAIARHF
ncbi:MAG TPA: DUF3568 family protein [Opitutaceae bacterium]|nr:DUF3568 family protein [Opitutaceae bacterium]